MKLSHSFIVSSLLTAASASRVGHVYTYDPIVNASPQPPSSSSVTPEIARLIFAQRLGLSRFHSIRNANDKGIQQINAYGGRPQKLFGGEDGDRSQAHILVWVEEVEDVTAIITDASAYSAAFTVSDPPPSSASDRLLEDFILQAAALPKKADPKHMTHQAGIDAEAMLKASKDLEIHSHYLGVFRASKADKLDLSVLSSNLASLVAKSAANKDQGFSITIVLMPPTPSHSKRAAHPYGTYDLPFSGSRREPTEAPLSPSSSPVTPLNQGDSPFAKQANNYTNYTSPVLGILPSCFTTADICIEQTHNCSGHGFCKVLHKKRESNTGDCYGCFCEPDVKHIDGQGNEEKTQTTYWGGPACQKKDISAPFFLFVTIGVLLAALISASIGMMFSMGNQELPSVIGAGVSGPAKK